MRVYFICFCRILVFYATWSWISRKNHDNVISHVSLNSFWIHSLLLWNNWSYNFTELSSHPTYRERSRISHSARLYRRVESNLSTSQVESGKIKYYETNMCFHKVLTPAYPVRTLFHVLWLFRFDRLTDGSLYIYYMLSFEADLSSRFSQCKIIYMGSDLCILFYIKFTRRKILCIPARKQSIYFSRLSLLRRRFYMIFTNFLILIIHSTPLFCFRFSGCTF